MCSTAGLFDSNYIPSRIPAGNVLTGICLLFVCIVWLFKDSFCKKFKIADQDPAKGMFLYNQTQNASNDKFNNLKEHGKMQ